MAGTKNQKAMKLPLPTDCPFTSDGSYDPAYDNDDAYARRNALQDLWKNEAIPAVPARNTSPSALDLVEFYNEIEPLRSFVDAIRSCYGSAMPVSATFSTTSVNILSKSHLFPEWSASTTLVLTKAGLGEADHRADDDSLVARFFSNTVRMSGVPDVVKKKNGVIVVGAKVIDIVDALTKPERMKLGVRVGGLAAAFAQNHPNFGPFLSDWRRGEFDRCRHRFHRAMQEFKDVDSDTLDALVRDWVVSSVHDS